jgi:phage shock protein PspC (stress-responsive transcriptional regulator)
MNETTAPHVDVEEPERLLVRPADDRLVAGVCAGLARYFDMSPVVYRVAFAALVLLGGAGIVLYAAAWLVIPDERRGTSIAEQALREHRTRPWLPIGVGLVVLALLLGLSRSRLWPDPGEVWLAALVLGGVLVWWQVRQRDAGSHEAADPTAPAGEPAPEQTAETAELPPTPTTTPPRRRLPVFAITVGVVIAAVGVLGLVDHIWDVDIDWTLMLGGAVILVGFAVVVGAFFGGTGALAAFGVLLAGLLAVAVTADLPLEGPIGARKEHPATVQELDREYSLSIGQLIVDVSDVDLPAGTTSVDASVGVGELIVYVPREAHVVVDSHVQAGGSEVFGRKEDGWNVHQERASAATASTPTLELDANVGFGDLEVHRR